MNSEGFIVGSMEKVSSLHNGTLVLVYFSRWQEEESLEAYEGPTFSFFFILVI